MSYRTRSPWRNKEGTHISWILFTSILFAFVVALGTWNPSGYSYLGWLTSTVKAETIGTQTYLMYVVSVAVAAAWTYCLWAAWKRLRPRTIVLAALAIVVLYAALHWTVGMGNNAQALAWIALIVLSILLGFAIGGKELDNLKDRLSPRRR